MGLIEPVDIGSEPHSQIPFCAFDLFVKGSLAALHDLATEHHASDHLQPKCLPENLQRCQADRLRMAVRRSTLRSTLSRTADSDLACDVLTEAAARAVGQTRVRQLTAVVAASWDDLGSVQVVDFLRAVSPLELKSADAPRPAATHAPTRAAAAPSPPRAAPPQPPPPPPPPRRVSSALPPPPPPLAARAPQPAAPSPPLRGAAPGAPATPRALLRQGTSAFNA